MKRLLKIRIWALAATLILALALPTAAQDGSGTTTGSNGGSSNGSGGGSGTGSGIPGMGRGQMSPTVTFPTATPPRDAPPNPDLEAQQEKTRNADRQKQLVAATDKLLALANELKADVDKTNKDTMSLDVIKKADEIEKLAHNVKEKMKCSGCGVSLEAP